MLGLTDGIGAIITAGTNLIKSYFPPDLTPEQKAQLEAGTQKFQSDITQKLIDYSNSIITNQKDVIVSEAGGDSWLQRNWRPITMLVFVFIIANNYILVPYVSTLFGASIPTLTITTDMWGLLKLGIGGYIAGRSVEKSIRMYNNGKK